MKTSLSNPDNYFENTTFDKEHIVDAYICIIREFTKECTDKLFKQNISISDAEFHTGLFTLFSVFNTILISSNNLKMAKFNAIGATFYYIEFISEIKSATNNFLQLDKLDAQLFILKKTVYDIPQDRFLQNSREPIYHDINTITNILKLLCIFNNYSQQSMGKSKFFINGNLKYIEKIMNYIKKYNVLKFSNVLSVIFKSLDFLNQNKNVEIDELYKTIQHIIRFIVKSNDFESKISKIEDAISHFKLEKYPNEINCNLLMIK